MRCEHKDERIVVEWEDGDLPCPLCLVRKARDEMFNEIIRLRKEVKRLKALVDEQQEKDPLDDIFGD